jgi:hypothetical protein
VPVLSRARASRATEALPCPGFFTRATYQTCGSSKNVPVWFQARCTVVAAVDLLEQLIPPGSQTLVELAPEA